MTDYQVEPFDLRGASDAAYAELLALNEAMRAERLPDDPPFTLAMLAGRFRGAPAHYQFKGYVVRAEDEPGLVAELRISADLSGENAHLAQVEINVLKAHRRRGLGRRLLALGAEEAQAMERRLLLGFTNSRVPDGEAMLRAVGAQPGLEERHSQLDLAELDRELLRQWQARAAERAAGFELLFWDHHYPEGELEAFANLSEDMNTAPRGDLEVEDQSITPEKARQWLVSMEAAGFRVWTIVARERATGALAGYSEVLFNPDRPTIVNQGATVVRPAYRGRGLGRWLKADMLEHILRERPQARFVRTDNAESNAPMLAINVALGFRPFMGVTIWQVETERALAWANMRAT